MGSGLGVATPYDHNWRKVRLVILDRDGRRCQIRSKKCTGVATQVDHIVPILAGGARLDPSNLRAACKPCNVGRANTEKFREGWRRSKTRITLVVGPSGAGKSTWAARQATSRDVVVDYDVISQAFGPANARGAQGGRHGVTMAARNAVLTQIRRGEVDAPRVFVVSANPNAEDLFPHHEVQVVDPGRDEVLRRAVADGRSASTLALVDQWYQARSRRGAPSRDW